MAMEIPLDLIKQVQISLRKEAKVPAYDPDDSSLPTLHSFDDSIAELDALPAHLRCRHCKGRLLRGSQSLLCIFCGKRTRGDGDPTPPAINFRSTVGYHWFLQSLGLDGSELVQPSIEAAKSDRGRNASQVEVKLSDLLDLEVQWHDEPEKFGADENFFQQKGLLSLVGFDVDMYSPEGNGDSTSGKFEGQFPPTKDVNITENNSFQGPGKGSALENVQTAGWEADFQSSESKTTDDDYRRFDHIVGLSRDLPSSTDEGLGPRGHSLASHSNIWVENDTQHTSGVWETSPALEAENDGDYSFEAWNDFESSDVVEDASGRSLKPTDNAIGSMECKSGSSFSGLAEGIQSPVSDSDHEKSRSSNQLVGSSFDLSAQMDEIFGSGKSSFLGKGKDDGLVMNTNNWLVDDLWSNQSEKFGSAVGLKNGKMEEDPDVSSSAKRNNRIIIEDDHSFGTWDDFKSSTSTTDALKNSSKEVSNTRSMGEGSGDPFSSWESEFQSVKSKVHHGASKPPDPSFLGSSVDLSTQMDAVFEPTLKEKGTTNSVSSSDNWFHDDQWNDLASGVSPQGTQYDMSIDVNDSGKLGKVQNFSPMNWFPDDQLHTTGNNPPDRKTGAEDDDSSEAWDFKSSTGALKQNANNINLPELSFATEQLDYDVEDRKIMERADKFSVGFDWMQDDPGKISSNKLPDNISTGGNDDTSDAWNDFTSSVTLQDTSSSYSKQTFNHLNSFPEISDMNLLSMDHNPQKNDAGSISQPDLLFETFGNQHVLSEGDNVSDRNADAPEGGGNAEVTTDDVETLMSQMHDLSFMLESNLSLPSKGNGSKG